MLNSLYHPELFVCSGCYTDETEIDVCSCINFILYMHRLKLMILMYVQSCALTAVQSVTKACGLLGVVSSIFMLLSLNSHFNSDT